MDNNGLLIFNDLYMGPGELDIYTDERRPSQNPLVTLNGQKVGSDWLLHAETGQKHFKVGDSVKIDPSLLALVESFTIPRGVLQTLAMGIHLVVEKITRGSGGPDDTEVTEI